MPSRAAIDRFLALSPIALVGASRDPKDFSHAVATQLRDGGRTVHLVNPESDEIDGQRCYRTLAEVPDPLEGVLVMVPAGSAAAVARASVQRGVTSVWLHRGAGAGSVSGEAVALCRESGVDVIDGACPLMFTEPVAWFHRAHHFLVRRRFAA